MTPGLIERLEAAGEGSRELQDRILAHVEFDTVGGCWLWTGSMPAGAQQRGFLTVEGRSRLASRTSFQAFTGIDPSGGMVCHKCDVPACVNPAHLYLGDHRSNMADMVRRGRGHWARNPERARQQGLRVGQANTWCAGEGNPKAKLSAEQVAAIRADRRPTKAVAESYAVNRTTIQRIRRGAQWSDAAILKARATQEQG